MIVELKSVQNIAKEHEVQLVNYLNGLFPKLIEAYTISGELLVSYPFKNIPTLVK